MKFIALGVLPALLSACPTTCDTLPDPPPITTAPPTVTPLFVNPQLPFSQQADEWASTRPSDAAVMRRLAATPMSMWLGMTTPQQVEGQIHHVYNTAGGALPVFVLYNIPFRDLGGQSAGGAGSEAGYYDWIDGVARGIAGRKAIVIVEPDALMQGYRYQAPTDWAARVRMLSYAVAALPTAETYVDTATSRYVEVAETVAALNSLTSRPTGFSTNVAMHATDDESVAFGRQVHAQTGLEFVVDSSRNGAYVASNEWCNVPGRALGRAPTVDTGDPVVRGFLWIKTPGQSDGACRPGEPPAGGWMPEAALTMARLAGY
jgi:endoglucanase